MWFKRFSKLWEGVILLIFLIYGTYFQFIHESKFINFICLNSKLRKKLKFDLENLLRKNPSCYRHFKPRIETCLVVFILILWYSRVRAKICWHLFWGIFNFAPNPTKPWAYFRYWSQFSGITFRWAYYRVGLLSRGFSHTGPQCLFHFEIFIRHWEWVWDFPCLIGKLTFQDLPKIPILLWEKNYFMVLFRLKRG